MAGRGRRGRRPGLQACRRTEGEHGGREAPGGGGGGSAAGWHGGDCMALSGIRHVAAAIKTAWSKLAGPHARKGLLASGRACRLYALCMHLQKRSHCVPHTCSPWPGRHVPTWLFRASLHSLCSSFASPRPSDPRNIWQARGQARAILCHAVNPSAPCCPRLSSAVACVMSAFPSQGSRSRKMASLVYNKMAPSTRQEGTSEVSISLFGCMHALGALHCIPGGLPSPLQNAHLPSSKRKLELGSSGYK